MEMKQFQALMLGSAIMAIGMGLIFIYNYWFPGVFFLVGATIIPQATIKGWSWYVTEASIFMIGMGIVFVGGFSIGTLFLVFGVMGLYAVLNFKNSPFAEKFQ